MAAQHPIAQMHLQVAQTEHAQMTRESLHPDAHAGLCGHLVEQVMRVVEPPLGLDRHVDPELVGDVVQGPLEVGRELAGVAPCRPSRHPVTLDEHHPLRRRPEDEERSRNAGDAGADDDDIRGRACVKWAWWSVRGELGDPGRLARLVRIPIERWGTTVCRWDLPHCPSRGRSN